MQIEIDVLQLRKTKKLVDTLNIFGRLNNVYRKYTLNPCPSSVTISRKFTAWITHTIKEILIETSKKNWKTSFANFLKINFFIEIWQFWTYITFQPKVYM